MKHGHYAALAIGIALASIGGGAAAQNYPDKPITLIAPFAPGASADGVARVVARELSQAFGKPVVVENRAGAGGTTGLIALAHAAPDGYTLAIGATGAISVNRHLPDAAPLNPDKQLAPVAKVVDIPLVFVAGEKSGLKKLADVVPASDKGGGISYGTSGQFTSHHLAGALFASMSRANLVAVPYRGSAPALTDVMAGQIPLGVVDLTSAIGAIKGGKVNALAVTSPKRAQGAPDVPTVAESGYPGYSASGWLGLFAPAGTPPEIVAKVAERVKAIVADPKVDGEFATLAVEPAYLDTAAFGTYIDSETAKWGRVVKEVGTMQR
ncbi:Bug family tripartite tricarboxylate transporter substrate binding protein [Bordetella genomosp. 13]|uniref:Bug family tripartite tricarboxylate transporter substrate binding protein n=1 Tax=Bordetella genomosp. 13 TaxID=463040 RepID=UPI0011A613FE|nr:tripartite tricarboxylate transporter substrate-binding protein [Bordetella genomosp. 13]